MAGLPKKSKTHNYCDLLQCVNPEARPITVDEACSLRLLLFNSTHCSFGEEWTKQGLHFRSKCSYGILQKQAGPCGVLAAVQGYVLKELLFSSSPVSLQDGLLRPQKHEKSQALACAVKFILWQAGDMKNAIVAVRQDTLVLDSSNVLQNDELLEYLTLKYFDCEHCLTNYILNYTSHLTEPYGCILFLYSVLLTHGIDRIKQEMDSADNHLIGDDGYCSQEVINLLLVGKAVSNLFDGDVELNSGGSEISLCKGIHKRSIIGLLSVYEYQNVCEVGSNYKDPLFPIWLLFTSNHFTILYGMSLGILTRHEEQFLLYHYDELAKSFPESVFDITPFNNKSIPEKDSSLPSVVKCILTRWSHATITELHKESN